MVQINQIQVNWVGTGVIGVAASTFYSTSTSTTTSLTSLINAFNAVKALIPASVTVNVPATGKSYDDATGQLLGTWVAGSLTPIVGTGAGAFGSASGAWVNWYTNAIVRRHALVGRTFLVPLVGSTFNSSGVIAPANLNQIQAFANAVATAGSLRVWSRPTATHPVGSSAVIQSFGTNSRQGILRSRRQ